MHFTVFQLPLIWSARSHIVNCQIEIEQPAPRKLTCIIISGWTLPLLAWWNNHFPACWWNPTERALKSVRAAGLPVFCTAASILYCCQYFTLQAYQYFSLLPVFCTAVSILHCCRYSALLPVFCNAASILHNISQNSATSGNMTMFRCKICTREKS